MCDTQDGKKKCGGKCQGKGKCHRAFNDNKDKPAAPPAEKPVDLSVKGKKCPCHKPKQ